MKRQKWLDWFRGGNWGKENLDLVTSGFFLGIVGVIDNERLIISVRQLVE